MGRRITVELDYVLPKGADKHLENAFEVFFQVVEEAVRQQFNDYFCKTDKPNNRVRVVALMETTATSAEEAGSIVRVLTAAVNDHIRKEMESKMAH